MKLFRCIVLLLDPINQSINWIGLDLHGMFLLCCFVNGVEVFQLTAK